MTNVIAHLTIFLVTICAFNKPMVEAILNGRLAYEEWVAGCPGGREFRNASVKRSVAIVEMALKRSLPIIGAGLALPFAIPL